LTSIAQKQFKTLDADKDGFIDKVELWMGLGTEYDMDHEVGN